MPTADPTVEDGSTAHPNEAHDRGVGAALLDLEQHDAEKKYGAGDDGDHRDGTMEAAHHDKRLRGFAGDGPGGVRSVAEGRPVQHRDGAVGGNTRLETDAEAVYPVGRAEHSGEIGQMHPDVALAFGDLGGIRPRLIDRAHDREAAHRVGCRTEAHRVPHVESQLPGQTPLDRDARHLSGSDLGHQQQAEKRQTESHDAR
jgi:hypothetical protein